jgi:hypothetical protein
MNRREVAEQVTDKILSLPLKSAIDAIEAALRERDLRAAEIAQTCESDFVDNLETAGFNVACERIATAILNEEDK